MTDGALLHTTTSDRSLRRPCWSLRPLWRMTGRHASVPLRPRRENGVEVEWGCCSNHDGAVRDRHPAGGPETTCRGRQRVLLAALEALVLGDASRFGELFTDDVVVSGPHLGVESLGALHQALGCPEDSLTDVGVVAVCGGHSRGQGAVRVAAQIVAAVKTAALQEIERKLANGKAEASTISWPSSNCATSWPRPTAATPRRSKISKQRIHRWRNSSPNCSTSNQARAGDGDLEVPRSRRPGRRSAWPMRCCASASTTSRARWCASPMRSKAWARRSTRCSQARWMSSRQRRAPTRSPEVMAATRSRRTRMEETTSKGSLARRIRSLQKRSGGVSSSGGA